VDTEGSAVPAGQLDGTRAQVIAAKVRVPPAAALRRDRLQLLLETVWQRRLGVVIAPAGSGKTTLLAGFAAAADVPVAWYRAETWDADEPAMVRHLDAALTTALPELAGGWRGVEDAAAALERWTGGRAVLVVDDAHALEDTPAERALGRFVEYAPPWLAILVGSRVAPGFNLSRRRVSGELLEIGPDDLRFRAWEVERLFRDHYGDPVPPDDLAILARRTEGWAAGLQLFHLATRGKSPDERRRILSAVGSSSRLLREYLTWNVMAGLPDDLRDFLVDTCVLGRLTGPLCDRLLDRRGSAATLDELLRRQIFTVELDEADGSFRYHEVLRSHLDRMLVERIGEDGARARYGRAAELLEEAGAHSEALGAYSRAEDWAGVRRLLGGQGERLADGPQGWLDDLPAAIVRHEPWLELASARRARAEGRWTAALDAYARAELGFGASAIALVCHGERQALRAWFDPVPPGPATDWVRLLRGGLVREPLGSGRQATRHGGVPPGLVRGLLALAAGEVTSARVELAGVRPDLADRPVLGAVAGFALGVALLFGGDPTGAAELEGAEDAAERASAPWLARLIRAASRLAAPPSAGGVAAGAAVDPERDPWGAAIVDLLQAWEPGTDLAGAPGDPGDAAGRRMAAAERRVAAAERACSAFRRLGAGVLEAWARGLLALGLAESGSPEAREAAMAAESLARAAGAPGVRLLTYLAMGIADEERRAEYAELAEAVRRETGLADPPAADRPAKPTLVAVGPRAAVEARNGAGGPVAPDVEPASERVPAAAVVRSAAPELGALQVRTFGRFELTIDGRPVSLDAIKPRPRSLLRLLAVHAGSAVHREVIGAALWPEADGQTAARSLQVAVSAIRGLLADQLGAAGGHLIVREGEAYRLAVPPGAVDIRRFDRAVADSRAARLRGAVTTEPLAAALAAYGGELLPEEGPSDWIVELREHYRNAVVEVAREAAEVALVGGEPRRAIDACRAGLVIDRYHDPLWRLLIEARSAAGDLSAASRDRLEYEAILSELGLPVSEAVSASR
jgi:DNA-binding SARP family transcriptional activator